VLNALAAVAVGRELGLDWDAMSSGLKNFKAPSGAFSGVVRRMVFRWSEDYGHHPTEIACCSGRCQTDRRSRAADRGISAAPIFADAVADARVRIARSPARMPCS
jgi:hypothetical protein